MNHREKTHGWENVPPEARMEIEKFLSQGKKIEAIKVYRKHTDVTLKQAKEAVESVASGMGIKLTTGCLTLLLLFILGTGSVAVMPFLRWLL